jgi:adenylosuccinate synthase
MMRIGVRVCDLFEPELLKENNRRQQGRQTHGLRHLTEEQRPHPDAVLTQYLAYAERLKPYVVDGSIISKSPTRRTKRAV